MSRLISFTFIGLIVFSAAAIFVFELPWYYILLADLLALLAEGIIFRATVLSFYSNVLYMTGRADKAALYFKKAIDADTKESTVYLNYAVILVREGSAREALSYLEKAEKLKKNLLAEKNIRLTSASCYWILGEIDKAAAILEDMREKYEYVNVQVLTTLGYLYLLKGDFEKALEVTNIALADAPSSASAWDNLGQIYLKQEKMDKAKEAFLKALSHNAMLVDSLYFMGVISKKEGDFEASEKYFEQALSCDISHLNTVTRQQIEAELKDMRHANK